MNYKLVNNDTGAEVKKGDKVKTFHGEFAKVVSVDPPRHMGSTGHVTTTIGCHYPTVYGLRFLQID